MLENHDQRENSGLSLPPKALRGHFHHQGVPWKGQRWDPPAAPAEQKAMQNHRARLSCCVSPALAWPRVSAAARGLCLPPSGTQIFPFSLLQLCGAE